MCPTTLLYAVGWRRGLTPATLARTSMIFLRKSVVCTGLLRVGTGVPTHTKRNGAATLAALIVRLFLRVPHSATAPGEVTVKAVLRVRHS
jgi:hypothetical protein